MKQHTSSLERICQNGFDISTLRMKIPANAGFSLKPEFPFFPYTSSSIIIRHSYIVIAVVDIY